MNISEWSLSFIFAFCAVFKTHGTSYLHPLKAQDPILSIALCHWIFFETLF